MESMQNALNKIKKDAFMASIDLKETFYSILGAAHHQKYLKLYANEYLKLSMPNDHSPAMSTFTKITKVSFSGLRMHGHDSVVYVDDSYLQEHSYESCLKDVNDPIIVLRSLGFTIQPEKSVLNPTQNSIYLGFKLHLHINDKTTH